METNTVPMENMLTSAAQNQNPVQQPYPVQPVQNVQHALPVQSAYPQQDQALALKLRAQELITQARTIWAVANQDVMALYNTDPEIRARILRGEWDFIDVWKQLQPAQLPPVPVRSANGGVGAMNIGGMNDQQFEKLNEMLKRGAKVDMRY